MTAFLDAISPAPFRERIQALCAEDPAIQVLSWILGPERMLEWAHSVASVSDPILSKMVPPLPPVELRKITAAPEQQIFLWTGLVDVRGFLALFDLYGHRVHGRRLRVLDFGCGCGRLTRYLEVHHEIRAYASDVNSDLVSWCVQFLPNTQTSLNEVEPPLPYADKTYDLIFSLSVFSHLPEVRAQEWLQELSRLLIPGGILVVTTHGYPALETIRRSDVHQQMFRLDEELTTSMIHELPKEGYIYLPYASDTLAVAKVGNDYGNTFIDPAYIQTKWNTTQLRVLTHVPAGLRGWQDTIVLSRI
jgi:SAM-dependent methyltransferase